MTMRTTRVGRGRVNRGGFASPTRGGGGFAGFATSQSKTGLAYLSDRSDFSDISDAHAVVSFKNLIKKDATTKAKALEDLATYAREHSYEKGGPEEAVLEAWVQFYPRLSIDDSRKVRELAHNVQLELMKSARKRMERLLPKIVGPWIAGTFDRDSGVCRAATNSLSSFLTTDEKTQVFWKRCQHQILEYATNALKETPTTLSDMRTTSKEEARLKYLRVVYSSLSLVLGLLRRMDLADIEKIKNDYDEYLSLEPVWKSATSEFSYIRRATYELIFECLDKMPTLLDKHVSRLAQLLTQEAPEVSQQGSLVDYIKTLRKFSGTHPEIWADNKHPFTRLRALLESGSQGQLSTATFSFWAQMDALFDSIPPRNIDLNPANDVLASYRRGVARVDERLANGVESWTTYLSMVRRLIDTTIPEDARVELVATNVYPILEHYIYPTEICNWNDGALVPIVTRASLLISRPKYPDIVDSARNEWAKLAENFATRMSNSLPKVSSQYEQSQIQIEEEGDRWFTVIANVHRTVAQIQMSASQASPANQVEDVLLQPTLNVLETAHQLLKKRDYKPFGAAKVINAAFAHAPHILRNEARSFTASIFPVENKDELSTLVSSPSAPILLPCLCYMANMPEFEEEYKAAFGAIIDALLENKNSEKTPAYVAVLLSDANDLTMTTSRSNVALQNYLREVCHDWNNGHPESWDLFDATFTTGSLTPETKKNIAANIVHTLGSSEDGSQNALTALEFIARSNPEILTENETVHLELVTKLLSVTEIHDDGLTARADSLRSLVDSSAKGNAPLEKIIQENLVHAQHESLEIDTLVQQADEVQNTGTVETARLFPNTTVWMEEVQRFLQGDTSPALSLTSSFSGAYLLVKGSEQLSEFTIERDTYGASIPVRMASYTTKLTQNGFDISALPQSQKVELLYLLCLVSEVGSDQISVSSETSLWGDLSDASIAYEAEELISKIRTTVVHVFAQKSEKETCQALINHMLQRTTELTPFGLYTAKALSSVLQIWIETFGFSPAEEETRITPLNLWKAKPETVLGAVAFLAAYGELLESSKAVSNFCNRLISDVAGAKVDKESTILTLVLLNACMSVYSVGQLPSATNRLVFSIKQITTWFGGEEGDDDSCTASDMDPRLASESCRALQRLLPCIKDIYGPHWERSMNFCLGLWSRAATDDADTRLPYIHSSLKLVQAMEAIKEPNDDLEDTITLHAKKQSEGLITLLNLPQPSDPHPQQEIVNALISRMASNIPIEHATDDKKLYPLLASESRWIQTAGFNILHRVVPEAQKEMAVDNLLEKTEARLPEQLLALLCNPPTLEAYPDDVLEQFPTPVRSYLLAWYIIFDAFSAASDMVRRAYANQLAHSITSDEAHVTAFLEFVFDVLGHTASHPLNLAKEGFDKSHLTEYDIDVAESEPAERNMHWLMLHTYYLFLKYLPGSFHRWHVGCRSTQTKIAVDTWTNKNFSPILIDELLDGVTSWIETQEPPVDDKDVEFTVSRTSREVLAGFEIDGETASVAVRIPANYPVDSIAVSSIRRLAVDEKQWNVWIMITQGTINFSNCNIVEGLSTFRRSVRSILKDHQECAICYSIISMNKKTPDKRCGTCKNLFHKDCLYRWVQTSNHGTCPLCRSPITYGLRKNSK